jgi:hypothetical protein
MAVLKYYNTSNSTWEYIASGLQGPIGPTGATGPTSTVPGPTGPSGPSGPTGPDGGWTSNQVIRSTTGSTDTPSSADNGKLVTIDTSSGAVTITINTSLGLSAGQRIDFAWIGAASSVTFSASSTTINGTPGLKLRARYAAATLICLSSNNYILVGDLSA